MKNGINVFPTAFVGDGAVLIRFSDDTSVQSVEVACTVDLTDFGEVIGIEVLDWNRQLSGGVIDAPSVCGQVRWSYDEEVDAFYIHLTEGRGQIQRSAVGNADLTSNQHVVRFEVPISSAGGPDLKPTQKSGWRVAQI